jgi:hypothetical protein
MGSVAVVSAPKAPNVAHPVTVTGWATFDGFGADTTATLPIRAHPMHRS